jgi:dTDP-4-amino-4,6-dideoxygalactose transaminase
MTWRIPLSDVDFDEAELQAVTDVLKSKWLTMGAETQRFEQAFANFIGVKHAFAVSNATVALHLANAALGIGAGDEVIVPSLTFVATANAIKYTGATPVFVDITSEDDLGISPAAIEAAITPATKAITVMHYGGYLCDMDAINAIARKHNLAVIEDAAHAPGTELNDKKAGAFSDAACFSFFSNKNLVTGEGGMIVTDRDDLAERIKLMRSHGMTTLTWDRHKGHAHSYDVVTLGYNYRIDEIRSALGLTQLSKLPKNNERRREITNWYRAQLSEVDELAIPYLQHPGLSAAHLFPILLDSKIDRTAFIDQMKQRGIQTSIHYPPIHQFTYYRQQNGTNHRPLPLTESVGRREVTLPLYPTMSADDVKQVVAAIKDSISSVH